MYKVTETLGGIQSLISPELRDMYCEAHWVVHRLEKCFIDNLAFSIYILGSPEDNVDKWPKPTWGGCHLMYFGEVVLNHLLMAVQTTAPGDGARLLHISAKLKGNKEHVSPIEKMHKIC